MWAAYHQELYKLLTLSAMVTKLPCSTTRTSPSIFLATQRGLWQPTCTEAVKSQDGVKNRAQKSSLKATDSLRS